MKVCFRISSLGFGGAEQVFLSLARVFTSSLHWDVDFVVDHVRGEVVSTALSEGFSVTSLEVSRTASSILAFSKYIDRAAPDVVISAYTFTNAGAVISRMLSRAKPKLILTEHASLDDHWSGVPMMRRIALESIVRLIFPFSDCLVGVSNGIAGELSDKLSLFSTRVTAIHNPVRYAPRSHEIPQPRPTRRSLLAVGRISKPKNYPMLIRAFSRVLSAVPDASLTIVGGIFDVDEKHLIDNLVASEGIQHAVCFPGFTHDVESYYRSADIFVLSSKWEGFGNVLVEALAFGLPIVSTDCRHGPREILDSGKYGRLCSPDDPEALAEAILETITSTTLPDRDALLQRANDFSEQKISSKYEQLIRDLCNPAHSELPRI